MEIGRNRPIESSHLIGIPWRVYFRGDYIAAKNGGKHADLIPKFREKPIKEIEKSIRSYEKLIAEHRDKIANPSQYCQDWDNFHPNRKKALIEKLWPHEIQCYTEQKDVLRTILDQKN